MNDSYRNRLIGLIVIVLVSVVFLPDIFDGEKVSYQDDFKTVPEQPEIKTVPLNPTVTQAEVKKKLSDSSEPEFVMEEKEPVTVTIGAAPHVNDKAPRIPVPEKKSAEKETQSKPPSRTTPTPTAKKESKTTVNKKERTKTQSSKKEPVKKPESQQVAQKKPLTKPKQEPPKKKPKPVEKNKADKIAWVIQLGSFKNKTNVDNLVKKLRKAGFVVFTRPVKTASGQLTKVFVGPDMNASRLEKSIPKLEKMTKLKGKLSPYSPTAI